MPISFSDGHTHDFTHFKEKMSHSLTEKSLVCVYSSYLGIVNLHENTFIPIKNSKNHPLTEEDKQFNRERSTIRIKIEYFNTKFKTFQIKE